MLRQSTTSLTENNDLHQTLNEFVDFTVVSQPQNQLQATDTELRDLNQYLWHVFYHFVGMCPRSSDLHRILQRVWSIPSLSYPRITLKKCDVNSLAKEVLLLLSSRSEKRTLIIIDSIDKV